MNACPLPLGDQHVLRPPRQTQPWVVGAVREKHGLRKHREGGLDPARMKQRLFLNVQGGLESSPGGGGGRTPGRGRRRTRQDRTVGGGDTESAWEATTVTFRRSSGCVRREVDWKGEAAGR